MIRVPVKTKEGVCRVMRTRVPRTRTFECYRKAEEEAPELLKQIYAVISQVVEARPTEAAHRSAVLIERIPSDWPYRDQWLKFLDSEPARRFLFEQVLWTYFFDREETWETTWPDQGRPVAEYVRKAMSPPVARPPSPRPKAAAGAAPEVRTRGIGPATAAPAPAGTTEQFGPGDIVEITEGRYAGLTGQITEITLVGGFKRFTVRLPGDDQYFDVPNFPLFALKKAN